MADLSVLHNMYQTNNDLYNRFEAAFVKASWDVRNEDSGTANHVNRINLADKILFLDETIPSKYYRLLLSNSTIQTNEAESSDNDILDVVSSFYNQISNLEA